MATHLPMMNWSDPDLSEAMSLFRQKMNLPGGWRDNRYKLGKFVEELEMKDWNDSMQVDSVMQIRKSLTPCGLFLKDN